MKPMDTSELYHYESPEWSFTLDVPKFWSTAPPVPANSPYELIRFVPHREGKHICIVYREPYDPLGSLKRSADRRRDILAGVGFGGFIDRPATIGAKPAWTLDLEKSESWGLWSCRYYFIAQGLLLYRLGFGTSNKAGMFPVFDRIAQSFRITAKVSKSPWWTN
jgi:hypothetical protein